MIEIIFGIILVLGIMLIWMVFFFGWKVVKAIKNWRRGVHD